MVFHLAMLLDTIKFLSPCSIFLSLVLASPLQSTNCHSSHIIHLVIIGLLSKGFSRILRAWLTMNFLFVKTQQYIFMPLSMPNRQEIQTVKHWFSLHCCPWCHPINWISKKLENSSPLFSWSWVSSHCLHHCEDKLDQNCLKNSMLHHLWPQIYRDNDGATYLCTNFVFRL